MLPETYILPQIQLGSHVCSNLSVQLCLSHQAGRIHPGKQLVMIARDANSSVCKGLIKWNIKGILQNITISYKLSFKAHDSSPRTSPQPHDFHVYTPHKI